MAPDMAPGGGSLILVQVPLRGAFKLIVGLFRAPVLILQLFPQFLTFSRPTLIKPEPGVSLTSLLVLMTPLLRWK